MNQITTSSTSSKTMDITPIILKSNQITRLIFMPKWVGESSNQLRGFFRFQRKGPNDNWEDIDHTSMTTLKKNEGYELHLDGEEMAVLFSNLENIKALLLEYGHSYSARTFILDEQNANKIFLDIGKVENKNMVVKQLKSLESKNFDKLEHVINFARLDGAIDKIKVNLNNSKESFWQKFFEENTWVLNQLFSFPVIYLNGETYLGGKNSNGRNGQGGVATDFLLKNGSNGSFAVVEIKTPMEAITGRHYRGKKNTGNNNTLFSVTQKLTGGLIQLEDQIYTAIDYFEKNLAKDFKNISFLNPTGILVIGNYSVLTLEQKKSFDLFRRSIGNNQIITFDEVLEKLKSLKKIYEN
jgi:hypothetical protein